MANHQLEFDNKKKKHDICQIILEDQTTLFFLRIPISVILKIKLLPQEKEAAKCLIAFMSESFYFFL